MKESHRFIVFLIVSVLTISVLLAPFLKPGRAWTYDTDNHQFRIVAFHEAVKHGELPPGWTSQLVYGWGSPVFLFNWTLPYWMAEPFLFAGSSITDASKGVVVASIIFSFLSIFGLLFSWFGFWPGLMGAVFYEWALFRIYLLHTGGGLGTHAAFIFWPLIFWGLRVCLKNKTIGVGLMTIGLFGTLFSHQVMFLMILPLLAAVAWSAGRSTVKRVMVALVFSLGLGAFFWLPAFIEREFLHIAMTENIVGDHFLDFQTILHQPGVTPWLIGDRRFWYWSTGWNLLIVGLISTILWFRVKNRKYIGSFILFFWVGQFLLTPFSAVLWNIVPLLSTFQYPVRFQALTLFCGAILAGYVLTLVKRNQGLVAIVLITLVVTLHTFAVPAGWGREEISDSVYQSGNSTADAWGEYLPRWANVDFFTKDAGRFAHQPAGRILMGQGEVRSIEKGVNTIRFVVEAKTPVEVAINQFYFPGWVVTANSKLVKPEPFGHGEMKMTLAQGTWKVEAQFQDTPLRRVAKYMSIGTLVLGIFWLVWSKKRYATAA
jgi:hypothetical protein